MKRFYYILTITLWLLVINTSAQQVLLQQTVTDASKGQIVLTEKVSTQSPINESVTLGGTSKALNINWQYNDPVAIGSSLRISKEAQKTFVAWWLNNYRASLYGNSSTPIFEIPVTADFEFPIDMTSDGLYIAVGANNNLRVFNAQTLTLIWEKDFEGNVLAFKIAEGGSEIYLVENAVGGEEKSRASSYIIGQDNPLWTTDFEGYVTTFAISGDHSKLAFCQYSGVNKMSILNGENGEVIFDAFYYNQNPPAFSYDGKFVILGDYSGKAYLYEYDENGVTYFEKWNFKVGGGGSSAWVVGAGISADGSTVAIGTLVFLSSDYTGEIYLFNTYSNEPVWVYEDCGDEICSISISADGSLIAAAGWGPLNHSKPDFYLFRRQSNLPLFTINTPGSLYAVDLSPDGTYCSVTGKAVHARDMGNGGLLYNINTDPGGGKLTGNLQLQGAGSFENAKIVIEGIDDYYGYSDEQGNFEIKYIPAGSYTVIASKVGFYPDQQTNVVIDEGGITTINFSLNPTGNPPVDLHATQGAGYTILLNWEHPNPSATTGFNIYRKAIAEALFPETPIATIGNNFLEFEDVDVQPLITYYYVVTAILDQGAESPYSNEAQGWMASGFMVNDISAYVGTTPVIDGILSPGEWDDAFSLDASDFYGTYDGIPNPVGSVTMYFKVNEEMTEFYVACIDQNKTILEDNFTVSLYIDDNNDHEFPPPEIDFEGNYWARYFASESFITYRPIYFGGGVGQNFNIPDPQLAASDIAGYVVMELVIPMGDDEYWKLKPNELNQSGLLTFTTNFDGYWPSLNQQVFYPLTYGTITFGAEDDVPVPPTGTQISWDSTTAPITITMNWQQPPINDFDHFNIYINEGSGFELLGETIGIQIFYTTDNTDYTLFRVTTVDKAGQESEPSENMVFDITIHIKEFAGAQSFNIYPNPSGNITNINCKIVESGFYSIRVLDLNGRLIQILWEGDLESGDHFFRWNGKNENAVESTPGIYLINTKGSNIDITKKLIKL